MTEPCATPDRRRDRVYAVCTKALAIVFLPFAFVRAPRRARQLACQWALAVRYPAENLDGLSPQTAAAFAAARTEAFWRDGQLIGLTSGYRDPGEQLRLFTAEVRRSGSPQRARKRILRPADSAHVLGTALDIRPTEGARWLEENGGPYSLYRIYDNEWWHFEYRGQRPTRLAHPGLVSAAWTPKSGSRRSRTPVSH
ncbi:D-alanyl-D-alanine carboxypeptidase family protein [Fodinicola acaciae]|uniref:D-alanyl-D-alanine carboxypeptidase family protein n=1 Tax=Fodinicola acaciae TaxID=2681555 RepID=UPI0013D62AF1|nr:D-alanyl-D-alanine carboxypeptidase family protein [Fodinicola acaciae]